MNLMCLMLFLNFFASSSLHAIDLNQTRLDEIFTNKVNNVTKQGRLKKIWEFFLKNNGTVDAKKRLFKRTADKAQILDIVSTIALSISSDLLKNASNSTTKSANLNPLNETQIPSRFCPFLQPTNCDPANKFRSLDGSCNNLEIPLLGSSATPYKRYLAPAYQDGIQTPRTLSVTGNPLPNSRAISNLLFNDNFQFDNDHTHMVATFGQFITHDLSKPAVSADSFGIPLNCDCDKMDINCLPINIPPKDPVMKSMQCMKFTRSASTFSTFDCRLGQREQLNLLTHFLDSSQVYGSDNFTSNRLRLMKNGQLLTTPGVNSRSFLPITEDASCVDTNSTNQCFLAGDKRVNNNLLLTSMHTLFMREHNRIAARLAVLNANWTDERLFNEARRIVIAQYQHITYNEYLPALIGNNFMAAFDLAPLNNGSYYSGYNPSINPSIAGEFSSAAFRFGHSLVRNSIGRYDQNNLVMAPSCIFSSIVFRPAEAYNQKAGGIDSIFLSALSEPPSKFDTHIPDTLQNHLFEVQTSATTIVADDLAALNINRGRDHGMGSYNRFREKCGFPAAKTFDDLADLIPLDDIEQLASIYEDVDDIDIYVGGLSENSINGAIVGPTFSCIMALQFRDLKKGDRFYYENGPSATSFTPDQLNEINKISLSSLICNNVNVNFIQPNAFFQPRYSPSNNRVPCSQINGMDLAKWKE